VLAVWTAGIEARLIFLQVIRHPFYLAKANDQQSNVEVMAPKRGELLDRNGDVLAYSVDADTIVASPRLVRDAAKTVDAMCGVFADCTKKERADYTALLSKSNRFAYVRRGIPPEVARRVMHAQAEELARTALAAVEDSGLPRDNPPVALAGGVLLNCETYRERFLGHLLWRGVTPSAGGLVPRNEGKKGFQV